MKAQLAEATGTFFLVLVGTGAVVANDLFHGALGTAGIALAFGLVVTAMVACFAKVSGAHINPAVTVAFACSGQFRWAEVPAYLFAQLLGALAASALIRTLVPQHELLGSTLPSGLPLASFGLEIVLTLLLMAVILLTTGKPVWWAAVAIGGTVGLEALLAGPVTGASMNPARSIGPALVSGHLEHLWIYIAAPVIGAGGIALTWRYWKRETAAS